MNTAKSLIKKILLILGNLTFFGLVLYVTFASYPYRESPKIFTGNMIFLGLNFFPTIIVILILWIKRKLDYTHLLLFNLVLLGWLVGPIYLLILLISGVDKFALSIPEPGSSGFSTTKTCSRCHKVVSNASRSGNTCPYCGAFWSFETGGNYPVSKK